MATGSNVSLGVNRFRCNTFQFQSLARHQRTLLGSVTSGFHPLRTLGDRVQQPGEAQRELPLSQARFQSAQLRARLSILNKLLP
jgi:hypothetical protein